MHLDLDENLRVICGRVLRGATALRGCRVSILGASEELDMRKSAFRTLSQRGKARR